MGKSQSLNSAIIMKFVERIGSQLVTIGLNIILARLLFPEDFGTLAILNVFIILAQSISQSGISSAIVQRANADDKDFSTGFVLSIGIAAMLYGLIFLSAPWIAKFYNMGEITLYLRVLALVLFPGALNTVLNAIAMCQMNYRPIMIAGISASITSCLLAVFFAVQGFGIWALIIQQGASIVIHTLVMEYLIRWRASIEFSIERAKSLLGYGNRIIIAGIIDNLYYDVESLFIGKSISQEMLGYFTNARTYPLRLIASIKDSIANVIFPAMSQQKGNSERIKSITQYSIRLFTFIVFPIMFGMALVSEEFIVLFLTDKWIHSLVPLRCFCVSFSLMALSSPNIQGIKAAGDSKLVLRIETFRKSVLFTALLVALKISPMVNTIAYTSMISTIVMALIIVQICGSRVKYGLMEQLKDIWLNILATATMAVVVYFVGISPVITGEPAIIKMGSKIICGIIVYICTCAVTSNPIFMRLLHKLGARRRRIAK